MNHNTFLQKLMTENHSSSYSSPSPPNSLAATTMPSFHSISSAVSKGNDEIVALVASPPSLGKTTVFFALFACLLLVTPSHMFSSAGGASSASTMSTKYHPGNDVAHFRGRVLLNVNTDSFASGTLASSTHAKSSSLWTSSSFCHVASLLSTYLGEVGTKVNSLLFAPSTLTSCAATAEWTGTGTHIDGTNYVDLDADAMMTHDMQELFDQYKFMHAPPRNASEPVSNYVH